MKYRIIVFLSIFMIIFNALPANAADYAVGVSPIVINENFQKGEKRLVKFYLVTPSEDPMLVYMEIENGNKDFFKSGYASYISNYSEENSAGWIRLTSNPVELKPGNETLQTTGGQIKGWREINFMVNVPNNAEPGFHVVRIKPMPRVANDISGAVGANVVSVVAVTLLLNVQGKVARNGVILDVVPVDVNKLSTYFKNSGTVTMSVKAVQKIYDENGDFIAEIYSPISLAKPNEIAILDTQYPFNSINSTEFTISTAIEYPGGYSSMNSTVTLQKRAFRAPPVQAQSEAIPLWIIILIIVIIVIISIYIARR